MNPRTLAGARTQRGRMSLESVRAGRIERPTRLTVFGVESVGKSTFGSQAPAPIFLCSEDGTSELDVARLPEPATWEDVLQALELLQRERHQYRTLVIDTLDWLEPMLWRWICQKHAKQSIEDFGFGKGYTMALDWWRTLIHLLDSLQTATGMHVICLAHSWIRPFKNPLGEDFDRYEMKLHARAAALFKEWSDAVLFATFEDFATKRDGGKAKGVSTGERVLFTQRSAGFDAKCRYPAVPEQLPLDWHTFWSAAKGGPAELRKRIEQMIVAADEGTSAAVHKAVQAAGEDPERLRRILRKLEEKEGKRS